MLKEASVAFGNTSKAYGANSLAIGGEQNLSVVKTLYDGCK